MKMGQTHEQRYLALLLEKIERSELDPSFILTHTFPLEDAPAAYKTQEGCIKVVLKP